MARQFSQFRAFGLPQSATVTTGGNVYRRKHLEMIQRIREGIDPKPHHLGGFAATELSIPELDYAVIKVRYPDLCSRDAGIRTHAWKKFILSPESQPYRINRIKRGPVCRSITAR